jgi:homoserine kinase type II
MAVFTEVGHDQAQTLLSALELGELVDMQGIKGGIENTNYFVTASQDGVSQTYVLTLFERLSAAQLPFYLKLMQHLAANGIAVPDPKAHASGRILHNVAGKPAAVVNKLAGQSQLQPTAAHCAALGRTLAHMHIAAQSFDMQQPNLRGLAWWNDTVPTVLPHINAEQRQLLQQELAFQNHIANSSAYAALPRGPVHADLFRDNVMFEGDTLTGIFDFYFAGVDVWLFDVSVCLNDWAIHLDTGEWDLERAHALLAAYESVRPLSSAERALLNPMLRAAGLRFWTSRLWDFYLPREASMLKPHDPTHFERIVRARAAKPLRLSALDAERSSAYAA